MEDPDKKEEPEQIDTFNSNMKTDRWKVWKMNAYDALKGFYLFKKKLNDLVNCIYY